MSDFALRKCAKIVPKNLTQYQKKSLMNICADILNKFETDPNLFPYLFPKGQSWKGRYLRAWNLSKQKRQNKSSSTILHSRKLGWNGARIVKRSILKTIKFLMQLVMNKKLWCQSRYLIANPRIFYLNAISWHYYNLLDKLTFLFILKLFLSMVVFAGFKNKAE